MINKKGSGQMQWMISLVLIGLFTIAILGFSMRMATDSDSSINIGTDPDIISLNLKTTGNITQFKTESENTTSSILSSTIAPGSTTTTGSGQYDITRPSTLGTAKNIIEIGYNRIFGTDEGFGIFMTTFLTLMGGITTLYLIKLWRSGLPD